MQEKSHAVYHLQTHLPNEHNVYFESDKIEEALQQSIERDSMLTGWFTLNQIDQNAHRFRYTEIPHHYVWDRSQYKWKLRKQLTSKIVTRLYACSPQQGEVFYLRMLLLHVTGCKSFEDVRTYNGILHETFQATCIARGLLKDDNEWINCLTEACSYQMPGQLRLLFATICLENTPAYPKILWTDFSSHMIEDYTNQNLDYDFAINLALEDINRIFKKFGKKNQDFGLDMPMVLERLLNDGSKFSKETNREEAKKMIPQLNKEQSEIFTEIINVVLDGKLSTNCFFIDGPGGTGKTFLIKVSNKLKKYSNDIYRNLNFRIS